MTMSLRQPTFEGLEPRVLLTASVAAAIDDVETLPGDAVVIELSDHFAETHVSGTLVEVDTVMGSFYMSMYDQIVPLTVANFLNYVNDGDFADMFFHRLAKNFVLQGGTYKYVEGGTGPSSVVKDAPVVNEFANWFTPNGGPFEPGTPLNIRSTVSMAKLGGDPNSATNGFFVNLVDNSAILDPQNGGFTVFAYVPYGMNVIDQIAALSTLNLGTPYGELPVRNYSGGGVKREHLVMTEGVRVVEALTYGVSVSDTSKLVASINANGKLTLTPVAGKTGTVSVTVKATDVLGNEVSDTFDVTIGPAVIALTPADLEAHESGDTASFTVTRTGPTDADAQITMTMIMKKKVKGKKKSFPITGDAAVNVSGGGAYAGKVLTIPAGQSSVTVTIVPIDDTKVEGIERFKVAFKPAGGQVMTSNVGEQGATIAIADNDVKATTRSALSAALWGAFDTTTGEGESAATEPAFVSTSIVNVLEMV